MRFYNVSTYFSTKLLGRTYRVIGSPKIESFDGVRLKGIENEDEDILVSNLKIDQVKKMLNDKIIINGLTLVALQWFFLNYYKGY